MLSNGSPPGVLLLNASYEPMKIVSWQKGFILWFLEKVDILEHSSFVIQSSQQQHSIPSVLKLKSYVKRSPERIRFTRSNLFLRDHFRCQYCGQKDTIKKLTVDHVMPASRNGQRTWENTVTACRDCNQKKANRTPEEAKMPLLKKPKEPSWLPATENELQRRNWPSNWDPYLQSLKSSLIL